MLGFRAMRSLVTPILVALTLALLAPAPPAAAQADSEPAWKSAGPMDPYPSTYEPLEAPALLVRGATVLTGAGPRLEGASVLVENGRITAVGQDLDAPVGATVVDATGLWITPGLIDTHSHLGVYPSPGVDAHSDGNEATDPNTAQVWAEHSVWPQDPGFALALAGGVTSLQILPGSANLFGGRSVTLKNVPSRTVQGMKFPGAPYGLKMACGENPKRVYGDRGGPATRMGNFSEYRAAWIEAVDYRDSWERWRDRQAGDGDDAGGQGGREGGKPDRDLQMETLAGVLDGDILVHMHCYRADEMAQVLDLADEFGYRVSSFHHGVEAYKIRDLLAEDDVCANLWADWWGFKMEAFDGIQENIALVDEAGACAIVHSDSASGIQRLNQEAAKALRAGREGGIDLSYEDAVRWITANPAKALGIDDETGTLEPGKMADLVIWSGDPFSTYSRAEKVFVDGVLMFDRSDPELQPRSDFELGLPTAEVSW